jgi:hypothetical protein
MTDAAITPPEPQSSTPNASPSVSNKKSVNAVDDLWPNEPGTGEFAVVNSSG